jgi:hypothetical protein
MYEKIAPALWYCTAVKMRMEKMIKMKSRVSNLRRSIEEDLRRHNFCVSASISILVEMGRNEGEACYFISEQ